MTIPKFSSNYFGRNVDVFVLETPEPTFRGQASLKFPTNPKICTGIQKLAQIYIITLFTAVESKLLNPTEGTAIGDLVLGTLAFIEEEIRHILNIGNSEAQDLIIENQTDLLDIGLEEIPEDEQLDSSNILDIRVIDKSKVEFDVELNSVAGESRIFIIPLPLSIR